MSTLDTHVFPIQARLAIFSWLSLWEEIIGQKSGLGARAVRGQEGTMKVGLTGAPGGPAGPGGPCSPRRPGSPWKKSLLGLRGSLRCPPGHTHGLEGRH